MAPMLKAQLLLLLSLFALAASFPRDGDWRSRPDDVVVVPLERQNPNIQESGEDVDDYEDAPGRFGPPSSPWGFGFMESMQEMLWRMKNQMQELLSRLPKESFNASNGDGIIISPSWNNLPGNTTSTTKVINGHVVTVNETTYKQGDDGSSAFFHIRVVDIKPQQEGNKESSDEEVGMVKESISSPSSSMSLGHHAEVPSSMFRWFPSQQRRPFFQPPFRRQDEDRFTFEKPISKRVYPSKMEDESPEDMNRIDDGVDVFRNEEDNDETNGNVIDLSRDTLVNKLMSDQAKKGGLVALHPDVELLNIDNGKVVGSSEESFLQQKTHEPIRSPPVWEDIS